jgi:hypothetical protein
MPKVGEDGILFATTSRWFVTSARGSRAGAGSDRVGERSQSAGGDGPANGSKRRRPAAEQAFVAQVDPKPPRSCRCPVRKPAPACRPQVILGPHDVVGNTFEVAKATHRPAVAARGLWLEGHPLAFE